ncbi:MAG: hypothetical protein Q9227_005270 [Pyrenula ochraceoflavens]
MLSDEDLAQDERRILALDQAHKRFRDPFDLSKGSAPIKQRMDEIRAKKGILLRDFYERLETRRADVIQRWGSDEEHCLDVIKECASNEQDRKLFEDLDDQLERLQILLLIYFNERYWRDETEIMQDLKDKQMEDRTISKTVPDSSEQGEHLQTTDLPLDKGKNKKGQESADDTPISFGKEDDRYPSISALPCLSPDELGKTAMRAAVRETNSEMHALAITFVKRYAECTCDDHGLELGRGCQKHQDFNVSVTVKFEDLARQLGRLQSLLTVPRVRSLSLGGSDYECTDYDEPEEAQEATDDDYQSQGGGDGESRCSDIE